MDKINNKNFEMKLKVHLEDKYSGNQNDLGIREKNEKSKSKFDLQNKYWQLLKTIEDLYNEAIQGKFNTQEVQDGNDTET